MFCIIEEQTHITNQTMTPNQTIKTTSNKYPQFVVYNKFIQQIENARVFGDALPAFNIPVMATKNTVDRRVDEFTVKQIQIKNHDVFIKYEGVLHPVKFTPVNSCSLHQNSSYAAIILD